MMNVLFVFQEDYTNGGATSIMRQVAEYHLNNNNRVFLLFLDKKKYGHWDDLACDNLKIYYGGGLAVLLKNLFNIHHIFFDYSYTSAVRFTGIVGVLKIMGILQIKTVVARESTLIFNRFKGAKLAYYRMWYKTGYKAVDCLICQTEVMKSELLRHEPNLANHSQIVVIPNPVIIEDMNKKASELLDVHDFHPFVVTAGRFIPEKAYDILLDSFAEFRKKYKNMKLVILGDGVLRNQIEDQIAKLNIKKNVVLAGQVANVYPWFKAATLCVISSRMEGFPNVLLQMMSQNDRVVSTLCADGIGNIKGLISCPVDDVKALCDAMLECMEKDVNGHRSLFDDELNNRSIDLFISKIEKSLS